MANTYGSGAERGGVTRRDHHVRMVLGEVHVERAAFAEHPRHGALPALAVERDAHSRALGEQRRAPDAAAFTKGTKVGVTLKGKRWEGTVTRVLGTGRTLDVFFAADNSDMVIPASDAIPLGA